MAALEDTISLHFFQNSILIRHDPEPLKDYILPFKGIEIASCVASGTTQKQGQYQETVTDENLDCAFDNKDLFSSFKNVGRGLLLRSREIQSNFGFYHECNSLPRVSSRSFSFQVRRRPTRTDPAPSCRRPILWNPRWLWRGRMPSCPFLRDPSPAVGCEERGWRLRRLLRNTK